MAQLNVQVDERFELTSIVFCLAGAQEYQPTIPSYAEDIQKYFEPYKSSEIIEYAKEIREKYSISYGSVPGSANFLEIKNGKIRLQPQYTVSDVLKDPRWNEEAFTKYVELLNVFYKKSKFNKFFQDHRPLYDLAEQVVNKDIENITVDWFKSFYGKDWDPNLKLYISLTNGSSNYAIDNNAILLGVNPDGMGLPSAGMYIKPILIHEVSHHYTRDLFYSYWDQMESAANIIFPKIKQKMAAIAYGEPKTVIMEWLNRLCCMMYYQDNDYDNFKYFMYNENGSFIWMERSCDFMDNFYANRDKYPTIKEFMPQLVGFLNYTADNFESVEKEFMARIPYITSIYPIEGSDISNEKEIVVTFSEPMVSCGFRLGQDDGSLCLIEIDDIRDGKAYKWSEDRRKLIIKIEPQRLKLGSNYGITLDGCASNRYAFTGKKTIIYKTTEK